MTSAPGPRGGLPCRSLQRYSGPVVGDVEDCGWQFHHTTTHWSNLHSKIYSLQKQLFKMQEHVNGKSSSYKWIRWAARQLMLSPAFHIIKWYSCKQRLLNEALQGKCDWKASRCCTNALKMWQTTKLRLFFSLFTSQIGYSNKYLDAFLHLSYIIIRGFLCRLPRTALPRDNTLIPPFKRVWSLCILIMS